LKGKTEIFENPIDIVKKSISSKNYQKIYTKDNEQEVPKLIMKLFPKISLE